MTSLNSSFPSAGQESASPYAGAIAELLHQAPRQLSPQVAAEIGDLIGPLGAHVQDADAARPVA